MLLGPDERYTALVPLEKILRGSRGVTQDICTAGMCHFSGYRLHLFFVVRGIKEGNFSGAGLNMSKGGML